MSMCRICLFEGDEKDLLSINYAINFIVMCTNVKVDTNDGLPQFICNTCNDQARIAFNIKILCEESDMYLRSHQILNIAQQELGHRAVESNIEISKQERENASSSGGEEKSKEFREKFKCGSCDQFFYYKKRLVTHEQKHKEGFVCKECGKNCGSAKHLALHVSMKKRRGSHLCQICGKKYTMPENLKRHQRVHDGIRPFSCQLCEKSFTQSNELKSHMISHSTERPYLCNFCGLKYRRKESLQVHIARIHASMGKQFICNLCGKAFKGLVDMRIHKSTHSGRNHVCKICDKRFNKSSNLKVHERIHTGQKPFICHICEQSFVQKHVLNKHLNSHPSVQ